MVNQQGSDGWDEGDEQAAEPQAAEESAERSIVWHVEQELAKRGGGHSIESLGAAAEGATAKQVRNAIDELRSRGVEVVSYKHRYWLAEELRDEGLTLVAATKGGVLKVAKPGATKGAKAAKGKAKDAKPRRGVLSAQSREEALAAIKADLGEHPDPIQIAQLVFKRYDRLQRAKVNHQETLTRTKAMVEAEHQRFKEAVEEGIQSGDNEAAVQKLYTVQTRWQEWEEAKAEGIEERKAARAELKRAEKLLAAVAENAKQLTLFPGEEQAA